MHPPSKSEFQKMNEIVAKYAVEARKDVDQFLAQAGLLTRMRINHNIFTEYEALVDEYRSNVEDKWSDFLQTPTTPGGTKTDEDFPGELLAFQEALPTISNVRILRIQLQHIITTLEDREATGDMIIPPRMMHEKSAHISGEEEKTSTICTGEDKGEQVEDEETNVDEGAIIYPYNERIMSKIQASTCACFEADMYKTSGANDKRIFERYVARLIEINAPIEFYDFESKKEVFVYRMFNKDRTKGAFMYRFDPIKIDKGPVVSPSCTVRNLRWKIEIRHKVHAALSQYQIECGCKKEDDELAVYLKCDGMGKIDQCSVKARLIIMSRVPELRSITKEAEWKYTPGTLSWCFENSPWTIVTQPGYMTKGCVIFCVIIQPDKS